MTTNLSARTAAREAVAHELTRIADEAIESCVPLDDSRYLRRYASHAADDEAGRRALADLADAGPIDGSRGVWADTRKAEHLAKMNVTPAGRLVHSDEDVCLVISPESTRAAHA